MACEASAVAVEVEPSHVEHGAPGSSGLQSTWSGSCHLVRILLIEAFGGCQCPRHAHHTNGEQQDEGGRRARTCHGLGGERLDAYGIGWVRHISGQRLSTIAFKAEEKGAGVLRGVASVALVLLLSGCLSGYTGPDGQATGVPDRVRLMLTDAADRIVVRQYYVEGRAPHEESVQWFVARLGEITGKQRIDVAPAVQVSFGPASTAANWTDTYEAFASLDVPSEPGAFTLPILYLDGHGWNGYTKAAGWQALNHLVLFPDTFRRVGLNEPVSLTLENPAYDGDGDRRVLLHEAGHMLGLVNNGLPMQRDHVDRAEECLCHSSNPKSLMYTGNHPLLDQAQRGFEPVLELDEDDQADIQAYKDSA